MARASSTRGRRRRKARRSSAAPAFGGASPVRTVRGFASPAMLKAVAGTAAGFILAGEGINFLAQRWPQHFGAGNEAKRSLAKAALAVAGGMIASRVQAVRPMAVGIAAGAAASAALDFYRRWRPNALGGYESAGGAWQLAGYEPVAPLALPAGLSGYDDAGVAASAGLGGPINADWWARPTY